MTPLLASPSPSIPIVLLILLNHLNVFLSVASFPPKVLSTPEVVVFTLLWIFYSGAPLQHSLNIAHFIHSLLGPKPFLHYSAVSLSHYHSAEREKPYPLLINFLLLRTLILYSHLTTILPSLHVPLPENRLWIASPKNTQANTFWCSISSLYIFLGFTLSTSVWI